MFIIYTFRQYLLHLIQNNTTLQSLHQTKTVLTHDTAVHVYSIDTIWVIQYGKVNKSLGVKFLFQKVHLVWISDAIVGWVMRSSRADILLCVRYISVDVLISTAGTWGRNGGGGKTV